MRGNKPKNNGSFRKKIVVLGIGSLLVIVIVTSFFGKKGVMDISRARKNIRNLQAMFESLEEERARLEREIRQLERDPRAIEKEAREKLWLIKPGEKVVVLPDIKK